MTTAAAPPRQAALVPEDPLELVPRDAVVVVAMSGGVDSSVAAARCRGAGLRTIGITLAMWPRHRQADRDRGCCSAEAVEDARRVAASLDIPHYAWNLEAEFAAAVITDYEDEYAAGRTPNPCVRCNQRVKFGVLLERALEMGATHIATGHHARLGRRGGRVTLHRSRDAQKDQSYTLHRLGQARLARSVLPLGAFGTKAEVRAEAVRLGLSTAAKPDSQELCFVNTSVSADLARRLAGRYRPGAIVDTGGTIVGQHRGMPFYTVGQRAGLGISPPRPDAAPLYVLELDPARNRVVVGPRQALQRLSVRLADVAWVGEPPAPGEVLDLQLRAHGRPVPVRVEHARSGLLLHALGELTQGAPGQSGVLYWEDEVVGGGVVVA